MRPVLKDLLVTHEPIQLVGLVARVPIPQRVMMSPLDGRDRVNLDVAKVLDCCECRVDRTTRWLGWWQPL